MPLTVLLLCLTELEKEAGSGALLTETRESYSSATLGRRGRQSERDGSCRPCNQKRKLRGAPGRLGPGSVSTAVFAGKLGFRGGGGGVGGLGEVDVGRGGRATAEISGA